MMGTSTPLCPRCGSTDLTVKLYEQRDLFETTVEIIEGRHCDACGHEVARILGHLDVQA